MRVCARVIIIKNTRLSCTVLPMFEKSVYFSLSGIVVLRRHQYEAYLSILPFVSPALLKP